MYIFRSFLVLIISLTVSVSLDLFPLELTSCPKNNDDPNSHDHTCSELVKKNVSCYKCRYITHNHTFVDNNHHGNNMSSIHQGLQHILHGSLAALDRFLLNVYHPYWFCDLLDNDNCTVNTCVTKCCEGWSKDKHGRCNIRKNRTCENGGVKIDEGLCLCPRNFAGPYCDIAVCQDECLNGGTCVQQTSTGNACNCPDPYIGPRCETVNCTQKCENGGKCVVTGFKTVCLCPEGFYGKTCSSAHDDMKCPTPTNKPCEDYDGCRDGCSSSRDCIRDHVCCNDGCCSRCVEHVDKPCFHDGKAYAIGEMFRINKCTVCVCLKGGTISCTDVTCPDRLPCRQISVRLLEDQCCPTCSNNSTLPPNYQPPILQKCLRYGILTVPKWSSRVYVTGLGVKAYDFENKALNVHYSPLYLEHCKCSLEDREAHPVVVSAQDKFGRTSVCQLPVLLLDQTAPTFVTCPTDIYAIETEQITWAKPDTRDNVGVRYLKLDPPGRGNNGHFPVGNHTMTYTAIDYDGNRAYCQFTIFIFDKDYINAPEGLSRREKEQHVQIIAGCLAFAFLVLAILLVACFVRRWRIHRASAERRCRDRRIPAVSNGEYGAFSAMFRTASIKPPPYSPPTPPPAYEELAVNAGASEVEQPPRYEDIYTGPAIMTAHAYDNHASDEVARQQPTDGAAEITCEQINYDVSVEQRRNNVQNISRGRRSETIV